MWVGSFSCAFVGMCECLCVGFCLGVVWSGSGCVHNIGVGLGRWFSFMVLETQLGSICWA